MPEIKPEPVKAEPKPAPQTAEPGIAELKALLEKQVAENEKARKEIEEQRSMLMQQNQELSGQMLILKAKIDRMDAERSTISPGAATAETDRLAEQIREGRAMIDVQKLTIEVQKDTISRLEEEVEKIKAFDFEDYASQEKQILAKIATELKTIKSGITEYDGKTVDVSGKVGSLDGDLVALKDRTENIEQDAFAARRTMDECAKTLEAFKAIMAEQSSNMEQMKNSVTILDSKVNSLRDMVTAGPSKMETEEIEALKAQMGGWGDELKSLRETLEAQNGRLESVVTGTAGEVAAVKDSLALDITTLRESVASDLASVKESFSSDLTAVRESVVDLAPFKESVSSGMVSVRESFSIGPDDDQGRPGLCQGNDDVRPGPDQDRACRAEGNVHAGGGVPHGTGDDGIGHHLREGDHRRAQGIHRRHEGLAGLGHRPHPGHDEVGPGGIQGHPVIGRRNRPVRGLDHPGLCRLGHGELQGVHPGGPQVHYHLPGRPHPAAGQPGAGRPAFEGRHRLPQRAEVGQEHDGPLQRRREERPRHDEGPGRDPAHQGRPAALHQRPEGDAGYRRRQQGQRRVACARRSRTCAAIRSA